MGNDDMIDSRIIDISCNSSIVYCYKDGYLTAFGHKF